MSNGLRSAALERQKEVDEVATNLWNQTTHLKRSGDTDNKELFVLARVFAFLLLELANDYVQSVPESVARVLKVGIKAAKNGLGT